MADIISKDLQRL